MGIEGSADSGIFSFLVPVGQAFESAGLRDGGRGDVGPDSRLVVVEAGPARAIEHSEDFEDVGVAGVAVEFVAFFFRQFLLLRILGERGLTSAIETKDQRLPGIPPPNSIIICDIAHGRRWEAILKF
jgi:hypothetical protein